MALEESSGYVWGMLMGINQGCFELQSIEDGDYRIKFIIKNKTDGFRWALLSVYGAAQEEHREHFLLELVRAYTSCADLPFIVGGDFNIIRNPSEKIIRGITISGHSYLMLLLRL
jgi:hypothetical protein